MDNAEDKAIVQEQIMKVAQEIDHIVCCDKPDSHEQFELDMSFLMQVIKLRVTNPLP
tara:strand:+ start:4818 stop:4988 length:171 start_codon:yes stop_codon:yes gene_type:complete